MLHDVEERRQLVHVAQLAGEGGGEIEAEAVDVHFRHPVAQGVGDELERVRRAHEQRVSGAGRVEVVAPVAVHETVVASVVDAAEAQRGAHVVAFCGVVVDHVEDYLDAGGMVGLHHGFEFIDLFAARACA